MGYLFQWESGIGKNVPYQSPRIIRRKGLFKMERKRGQKHLTLLRVVQKKLNTKQDKIIENEILPGTHLYANLYAQGLLWHGQLYQGGRRLSGICLQKGQGGSWGGWK